MEAGSGWTWPDQPVAETAVLDLGAPRRTREIREPCWHRVRAARFPADGLRRDLNGAHRQSACGRGDSVHPGSGGGLAATSLHPVIRAAGLQSVDATLDEVRDAAGQTEMPDRSDTSEAQLRSLFATL